MDPLIQFSIPVKGLRNGSHEFHFAIDGEFFRAFEASPIQEADIALDLHLDKRPDLIVLEFAFDGTVRTECDRCLAEIDLPVSDEQRLLVKYSLEVEPEEADVVYVTPDTQKLNVAKFAYDFIVLAMPIIKVYDCRSEPSPPCNEEMLKYIAATAGEAASSMDPETDAEDQGNPIWEELKKWNNDN